MIIARKRERVTRQLLLPLLVGLVCPLMLLKRVVWVGEEVVTKVKRKLFCWSSLMKTKYINTKDQHT